MTDEFEIVIGNKNYSSWSLRAWLAMKATGAPFDEIVIPLYRPESKAMILEHDPNGRVPGLHHLTDDGDVRVWDSLAICEYLAEIFPQAGLWPSDPKARATARAIVAEMHSGFGSLRDHCPMDCRREEDLNPLPGNVSEDVKRICEIWNQCRSDFGARSEDPYLFGSFTIADCFFAPVAIRFRAFKMDLDLLSQTYCDAILAHPDVCTWVAAGRNEPWGIESYRND